MSSGWGRGPSHRSRRRRPRSPAGRSRRSGPTSWPAPGGRPGAGTCPPARSTPSRRSRATVWSEERAWRLADSCGATRGVATASIRFPIGGPHVRITDHADREDLPAAAGRGRGGTRLLLLDHPQLPDRRSPAHHRDHGPAHSPHRQEHQEHGRHAGAGAGDEEGAGEVQGRGESRPDERRNDEALQRAQCEPGFGLPSHVVADARILHSLQRYSWPHEHGYRARTQREDGGIYS